MKMLAATTGLCGKRYSQIKLPVKSKVEQIISFHTFENDNIPLIRFQVCFHLNFAIKIKMLLTRIFKFSDFKIFVQIIVSWAFQTLV